MTAGPLAGVRVVITRAANQAGEMIEALSNLGAVPVSAPLIDIEEPADGGRALATELAHLSPRDWLVVTSPNGAARVASWIDAQGAGRPQLAAIGSATAAALGTTPDLIPNRQIADGLVDVFPVAPDDAGHVLIAQAEQARADLADGLAAKGWRVRTAIAYRTVPVRPTPAETIAVTSADAVLFASGSAVRSWVRVFGEATPPVVIVIGPATAAVAAETGLKVDAIAADHSVGGMLTCLLTLCRSDEYDPTASSTINSVQHEPVVAGRTDEHSTWQDGSTDDVGTSPPDAR